MKGVFGMFNYKDILEKATQAASFSLKGNCVNIELGATNVINSALSDLRSKLSPKLYQNFKSAVIRASFFIELTNPTAQTDSTKYQVRWVEVLKTQNDIRYATYEQCMDICEKLFVKISTLDDKNLSILKDYCSNSVYTFELPIDYIERNANPFHSAQNIDIFITPAIERCTKVRKLIKDKALNPQAAIFSKIISQKIKVKAYQTDRAQTGEHQTNREKRWESHPDNYQFAFRRDCNEIEASLILQVCTFEGADQVLVKMLQKHRLLPQNFNVYRCPVTGEPMQYTNFKNEITHSIHGKSCFQVGHLNPLKSTGGHQASNIGWISEDGNRIQGSLSMPQVDELLKRIYRNRPELRE